MAQEEVPDVCFLDSTNKDINESVWLRSVAIVAALMSSALFTIVSVLVWLSFLGNLVLKPVLTGFPFYIFIFLYISLFSRSLSLSLCRELWLARLLPT